MFKKIIKCLSVLDDVKDFLESMNVNIKELNENVKDINSKLANLSERVSKLEGIVETHVKLNNN